jgi:hypothetical protein
MDVWIHIFLTSALVGGEWSASRLVRFTSEEKAPGTHGIGSWECPRREEEKIHDTTGTRTPNPWSSSP